jgi:hypothetical protein
MSTIRDELRARREARARYRALKRDLASYTTSRQVDDLLTIIEHQDNSDANQIRDIIFENHRPKVLFAYQRPEEVLHRVA